MCACKGGCEKYRADVKMKNGLRYKTGQKRCSNCDLFMFWDGVKCPCCNTTLRITPKSKKSREILYPEIRRM